MIPETISPSTGQAGNVTGAFTTATRRPSADATSQSVGTTRSAEDTFEKTPAPRS